MTRRTEERSAAPEQDHPDPRPAGFIYLWRKTMDSPIKAEPMLELTFIHILLTVNWKPSEFKRRRINPGQMVFSWRNLGERLFPGMDNPPSVATMQRRIRYLEEMGMVTTENVQNRYSVLTVCNWRKYQADSEGVSVPTGEHTGGRSVLTGEHDSEHTGEHTGEHSLNKGNKGKQDITRQRQFDEFWDAYPRRNGRRVGKKSARDRFAKMTAADQQAAVQAAKNYAASKQAQDGYARDPERFIRNGFWKDYLEPVAKESRVVTAEQMKDWNPHTGLE